MIQETFDSFEIIKSAIGAGIGGAAVYAAIKSDLSELRARVVILERSNDKAHERIDTLNESRVKG